MGLKKYNILEAVDRGIKLALDDYMDDGIDTNSNVPNSEVIENDDVIFSTITETVDLGLPSGTRWCTYNLGVNPKKLNTYRDWYGDYYSWAETKTKDNYTSDNYFFDLSEYHIRNYNKGSNRYKLMWKTAYGKVNKYDRYEKPGYIEMHLMDDAAYVNKQAKIFKFCIPTREQFREMVRSCSSQNVYDYNGIQNLNGKLFTSKINGNTLFLPFIGFMGHAGISCDKNEGLYWTSTLSIDEFTCAQAFKVSKEKDKNEKVKLQDNSLYNGFGIRPVLLKGDKRPKFRVECGSNKIKYYENGFE